MSPTAALRRELLEELGADIGVVAGSPELRLTDPSQRVDLEVWVVRSWRGSVKNRQPDEHDQIGWFTEDELGELTLAKPAYLAFLNELLAHGNS